jgi:four helix bundle protein
MIFERLLAWQEAHRLVVSVYKLTAAWPTAERYGLVSQARRAAVSIASNVAEGAAKRGPREFGRHLDVALGSLAELTYLLRLARDLGYLPPSDYDALDPLRIRTARLLWGLYRKMRPPKESP